MKNKLIIFFLTGILFSGCYTYNIPSGATTPLITEQGEIKASAAGNFNEAGGTFTVALTNHTLFSASGNFIFSKNTYKQDYDSLFFKKTPNNFEVAFGYYGGIKKFANNIMFGIGTGNNVYDYGIVTDYAEGYFQTEYVQYFLQYNAGFKYQKKKRHNIRFIEQGLSLRYAYHNYHIMGIAEIYKYEEIYNEETGYYDYHDYFVTSAIEKNSFFNSFSVYYFLRTGNDKIQFEVSPGFSFYDRQPEFYKNREFTSELHFNIGLVFNLNNLF